MLPTVGAEEVMNTSYESIDVGSALKVDVFRQSFS